MAVVDDLAEQMAAVQLMTDEEVKGIPQGYEDGQAGFGALQSERGLFPLRSVKVSAKISALSTHITLDQTFLNAFDSPLEATYIFPLPSRAAVTSFRLEVKDRVVEGLIKERGEARREYTEAIQQGHRAAIAEEERSGVFTLRVGNIGAGELASVQLTLAAPLPFADGEATFRFPLVVAPRYIPGISLGGPDVGSGTARDTNECPDASRISPPGVLLPGFSDPVQLAIEVEFDAAALPVSDVRSSLHTLLISDVEMGDSEAATSPKVAIRRLKLDPSGDRHLNRDFILRFHVANPTALATSLVLADDPDSESQEGTWQLTVIAPQRAANGARTTPRDVIFVLDRSGSMQGWKMVAARSATARIVDTLTDADRFSLIAFDSYVEYPQGHGALKLVAATDYNRQSAVQYLGKVDARGGTEMANPLNLAADALQATRPGAPSGFWTRQPAADSGRDRVLVLVTDGQVGNKDGILSQLAPKLQGVRIFTLGIDQSVNEGFLKRLAALTPAGACELVESQGRLENAMDRIHRLICTPALSDVQIDGSKGDGIEPIGDTCSPSKAVAVFTGVPTVVSGRYRKTSGDARAHFVTLSGKTAAGESWSQAVQAQQTLNPALGALWARARINELDDRFTIASGYSHYYHGRSDVQTPKADKPDELRARILALSLRHKVLCRFSAFVAVDRAEKVESDGSPLLQVAQPVESPAGWGSALCAPAAAGANWNYAGAAFGSSIGGSGQLKRLGAPRSSSSRYECAVTTSLMNYERHESSVEGCAPPGFGCSIPGAPPAAAARWGIPKGASSFGGAAPKYSVPMSWSPDCDGAKKKAKRPQSKAPAQTSNPNEERARALVSTCLRTVHQILHAKQVADSLLKRAVTEMKEILDRVDSKWQTGQSIEVLKGAISNVEAGGSPDWEKVKAALERIEQAIGSPKVGA